MRIVPLPRFGKYEPIGTVVRGTYDMPGNLASAPIRRQAEQRIADLKASGTPARLDFRPVAEHEDRDTVVVVSGKEDVEIIRNALIARDATIATAEALGDRAPVLGPQMKFLAGAQLGHVRKILANESPA